MSSKISALTADTTPTSDDLLVTVNDPGGTPANRKVTIGDLDTYLSASTKTLTNKTWQSNTIGEVYGGTGQSTWTLGDLLYSDASNSLAKLSGNITTTKQYLSQTGTGAVSAAPVWATIVTADISNLSSWAGSTSITTLGTIGTGTWQGTVIANAYIAGIDQDLLTTSSPTLANLTISTTGALRTAQSAGNTLLLQAYDVDGASYTTFATLTANNTPTMDLSTAVTIGGNAILDSTWTGSANITTVGTIGTGVWQGTAVSEAYGGTNQTTYTAGDILYASASNTLSKLAIGSNGDVLTLSAGLPAWITPSGGGNVSNTGTPADGQIAVWTDSTHIEGDANFTFDTTDDSLVVGSATIAEIGTNNFVFSSHKFPSITSASNNVAIGQGALSAVTSGNNIVAIGSSAASGANGAESVAIGADSLQSATAIGNVAVGRYALQNITTGGSNVGLGRYAGSHISGGVTPNQTSSNSVYIGSTVQPLANGDTNEIIIGYTAVGLGSNTAVLGNSSILTTALRGNVLVGGTTPPTTGTIGVSIFSGTAPTAVAADSFTLYSSDLSAGNTIPSWWTEGTGVITANGNFAQRINGTVYYSHVSTTDESSWGAGVSASGTPVDGQIAVWTDASTIEGDAAFTFDTTDDTLHTTNIQLVNGGVIRTGTTASDQLLIQAYDTDGTSYTTFATLTAGVNPSLFLDDQVTFVGNADSTKRMKFALGNITPGNTRSITIPDFAGTMVLTSGSQSISNKLFFSGCTWQADTIAAQYGGTGNATYQIGDLLYASGTTSLTRRSGNTTTTKMYLSQTGTGAASAAPVWGSIDTLGTISAGVWNGTAIDELYGGTGFTTYTTGDIIYASAANTLSKLGVGSNGDVLTLSAGVPAWVTPGAGGNVSNSGTPSDGQIAVWTDSTHIEGDAALSFDTTTDTLSTVNVLLSAGGALQTATGAGNTLLLQAYDVDGASYTTFATLTANNTPTMDLSTAVTIGGNAILDSTWTGSANITTLGTIGTGVWQGTAVDELYGGTGFTTYATGDILYASAANTLSKLAAGTDTHVLTLVSGVPAWQAPSGGASALGDLTDVTLTTPDTGALLYKSAGDWLDLAAGTATQVLHGGTTPSWAAVSLTADVSGTLPVANGGTNIASYTAGDIIYASAGTTLAKLAANATGTNQFLRSVSSGNPAWAQVAYADLSGSGSTSITTVGTIGTGTWQGTAIDELYGGTGFTTYATGDLLYASATNTLSKLTVGGTNTYLRENSGAPSWQALDISHDTTPALGGNLAVGGNTVDMTTANSNYELDPTLASAGNYNGETITGTASVSLSVGDLVYLNSSSQWALTDADAEATAGPVMLAISLMSGTGTGKFLLRGFVRATALGTGTAGQESYISTTPGDVTGTAPSATADIVRVVGYWYDTNTLYFNPSGSWVEIA